MAGGKGERFWPSSRRNRPKQLLPLASDKPLLVDTIERVEALTDINHTLIASNELLQSQISEMLPQLPKENLLAEPIPKDTAPCIAYAAQIIKKRFGPDAVMLVLSADHHVGHVEKFVAVLKQSVASAQAGYLTTIGITPDRPETQYGYLHLGKQIPEIGVDVFEVQRFVEKPDLANAMKMAESGDYLWNGGMFAWTAQTILDALDCHIPEVAALFDTFAASIDTSGMEDARRIAFESAPKISIDYGVMEKAEKVMTVAAKDIAWDDLGSWTVLDRMHDPDKDGNVILTKHIGTNTKNSIIAGDGGLVVTIGLEDLVVVRQDDVVLVARKDCASELKEVLKQIDEDEDLKKYL